MSKGIEGAVGVGGIQANEDEKKRGWSNLMGDGVVGFIHPYCFT